MKRQYRFLSYSLLQSLLLVLCCGLLSSSGHAAETAPHDGQMRTNEPGQWQAWDAVAGRWLEPEQFWENYAARGRGRYWGRLQDLPSRSQVHEFDTFILEGPHGACLMEFFHQRWRRANDVRRWDQGFDHYAGCGHVFDSPAPASLTPSDQMTSGGR